MPYLLKKLPWIISVPLTEAFVAGENHRTIGPENAHLKPDLGAFSHHEMTLTLNYLIPLLTLSAKFQVSGCNSFQNIQVSW